MITPFYIYFTYANILVHYNRNDIDSLQRIEKVLHPIKVKDYASFVYLF